VGVAVVVTFTSAAAWIGFGLIFGLPHAVLLSLAAGLLEIVPALGPATSMALVGLSATQQHSAAAIVTLMLYAILLRLVIDNGVGPVVLGQSARLHPVAVMFAFVCGAALLGVVGLLLAVPTAACLVVVLDTYYAEPVAKTEPEP
jgi:predicted PurR-regulated permease PerM